MQLRFERHGILILHVHKGSKRDSTHHRGVSSFMQFQNRQRGERKRKKKACAPHLLKLPYGAVRIQDLSGQAENPKGGAVFRFLASEHFLEKETD